MEETGGPAPSETSADAPDDTSGGDETGVDPSGVDESGTTGSTASCDQGCAADQLCHEDTCHPIGMSIAIGGGTDRQTVWAVDGDSQGNIYLAGDFSQNLELGGEHTSLGSGRDIFVAKLDPTGAPVWVRTFGSAEVVHQAVHAIAVDAQGDVIIGGDVQDTVDFGLGPVTSAGLTDAFVAKLNADGETIWARAFGDAEHQHLEDLAVDDEGRISLVGDFNGTLDFGERPLVNPGGGPDAFVAQLLADGTTAWSRSAAGAGNQHARGVALGPDASIHVCGEFRSSFDFDARQIEAVGNDMFVVRLGTDGSTMWLATNGDPGDDACEDVAVDQGGNVGLTGRFHDTLSLGDMDPGISTSTAARGEPFAAALDPEGGWWWSEAFGVGLDDTTVEPARAAFDLSGNLVLAGTASVDLDFGGGVLSPQLRSVYIAVFGPDGTHLRSNLYGDASGQVATAVAIDGVGNHLVAGEFAGQIDFGFGPHSVLGNSDGFVTRTLP